MLPIKGQYMRCHFGMERENHVLFAFRRLASEETKHGCICLLLLLRRPRINLDNHGGTLTGPHVRRWSHTSRYSSEVWRNHWWRRTKGSRTNGSGTGGAHPGRHTWLRADPALRVLAMVSGMRSHGNRDTTGSHLHGGRAWLRLVHRPHVHGDVPVWLNDLLPYRRKDDLPIGPYQIIETVLYTRADHFDVKEGLLDELLHPLYTILLACIVEQQAK